MVENLGRKLTLIASLLVAAIVILAFFPFRMGLDLQGGTRMTFRLDFDAAKAEGLIDANENENELLLEIQSIMRERVDPKGVLEPIIRSEGEDHIVVELPGRASVTGTPAVGTLAKVLVTTAAELDLGDAAVAKDFPAAGGMVDVGGDKLTYTNRRGSLLRGLKSAGAGAATRTQHEAGDAVTLLSDNAIRNRIENLGQLEFRIVASDNDLPSLTVERQKLKTWITANPTATIADYNLVAPADGGPESRIAWVPFPYAGLSGTANDELERPTDLEIATAGSDSQLIPLLRPAFLTGANGADWNFTGADLGQVFQTNDDLGRLAVGFEFIGSRRGAFSDFTTANVGRQMAIVLNGDIESAPTIQGTLPGRGIITGQFTPDEVRDLRTVLRTGSLRIKPILEHEERVGPTLGASYVRRGAWGVSTALVAVLGFMVFYYRRLGLFAVASLLVSMLLLMGGLAFAQATLTLPGIAGIILTVGMAVDANILIFDRVREEMDKGRNVKQAAKNGFDLAFSTILDANLTTLITAIILYNVGTGPIRGFAVTLSFGILASMFSALVVTRVLMHFDLEKSKPVYTMGKWLVEAQFKFISKAKTAVLGSVIAIVAGLALFVALPDDVKLGIDFTGGSEIQFRTGEPQTVEDMVAKLDGIGAGGGSVEVKPIVETASDGGYRGFRATFKTSEETEGFEAEVRSALGEVLQSDEIEVALTTPDEGPVRAAITLHFEEDHSEADVLANLESVSGLSKVTLSSGATGEFTGQAEAQAGTNELALVSLIKGSFDGKSDSGGTAFTLATPIPEATTVGAQVVGQLRDKAILALAISLFAIVMYIRVRFAEYSYGFAAVAALVHDVLITLGVLAVVMSLGLFQVEISLPLIAAFLTIIGYSLNDTIVLFDRVRENLPRTKGSLADVLDLSINQTLSRTILTSVTTLIAVTILFVFNLGTGNVLEGFAFAMVVGVLVGTYSSIFIAAPVFIWLETRARERRAHEPVDEAGAKATAGAAS